jgi:carbamoyl-phosphate synthase large subunit
VPYATTIETAEAAIAGIEQLRKEKFGVKSLQEYLSYKKARKKSKRGS